MNFLAFEVEVTVLIGIGTGRDFYAIKLEYWLVTHGDVTHQFRCREEDGGIMYFGCFFVIDAEHTLCKF